MKKKTTFQQETIGSLDELNGYLFLGIDDIFGEKDSLFFTRNFDTFIAVSQPTYESLKEKYAAEKGNNIGTLNVINSIDKLIYGNNADEQNFDAWTSLYGETYGFQRYGLQKSSDEMPESAKILSEVKRPTLYEKVKNYNRRDEIFYRTGTAISNIFSFFRGLKR